jgi:cell division protein FtsN
VTQCHRFGPFADAVASQRAQAQLQAQGLRTHVHAQEDAASARGWHVFLPPQSDRAAAQALAERIAAAGFSDLLVLTDGTAANGIAANGIALGRYRSEDGARRRQAALQAAGFEAQVAPLAALATQHWLDVAAAAGFDPVRSARAIGAAQHRALDCAAMPPAPAG